MSTYAFSRASSRADPPSEPLPAYTLEATTSTQPVAPAWRGPDLPRVSFTPRSITTPRAFTTLHETATAHADGMARGPSMPSPVSAPRVANAPHVARTSHLAHAAHAAHAAHVADGETRPRAVPARAFAPAQTAAHAPRDALPTSADARRAPPAVPGGAAGTTQRITALVAPPRPTVRVRPPSVAGPLAASLVRWMQQEELVSLDPARGPEGACAAPWLRVEPSSAEAQRRQRAMRRAFPRLDDAALDCVAWFMVRRAHAEHALPKAVTSTLVRGLQRALDGVIAGQNYTEVIQPAGAPHLLFLSAPHYDGCLFDDVHPVGGGGQAGFYVGLTRRGQPVAVKGTRLGGKIGGTSATSVLPQPTHAVAAGAVDTLGREAHQLRTAADYDVLHLVQHEAFRYLVMPLFCGDLRDHGAKFVNLRPATDDPAHGQPGLFGARYLLQLALLPLVTLHEVDRVVHQDIKDANLFVDRNRARLVLGDFGVSAPLGPDGTAPHIGHTERYAAPEQRGGAGVVSSATDIFCLGVMVYDLLLRHDQAVRACRARLAVHQPVAALMPTAQRVGQLPGAQREGFYRALADEAPPAAPVGTFGAKTSPGADGAPPNADSARLQAHFRNVHDALDELDAPLARLLRSLVARAATERPSARAAFVALERMGFDAAAAPRALHQLWTVAIAPHTPAVNAQLVALGGALRAIDDEARGPRDRAQKGS